jgi:hypothetical protein
MGLGRLGARTLLATLPVLAACTGAGMPGDAPGTGGCPAVTGVVDPQATLVTPAKGATGVPFTVSNTALLQGTLTLWVQTSNGNAPAITGGPIVANSANTGGTSSVPALQPATTYTAIVRANPPLEPGSPCKGSVTGNLGSFTTQ